MSRLVRRWVGFYTRDLPPREAERRMGEVEADLADQLEAERTNGSGDRRIARSIASRMVRGVPADISWRWGRARRARTRHRIEDAMNSTTAYRIGLALTAASAVFLLWGVAA